MVTTVYVVSRGCHSDYRIVGVFSTEEAAESCNRAIADDYSFGDNNAAVTPYDLDAQIAPPGMRLFSVHMSAAGNSEVRPGVPLEEIQRSPLIYSERSFRIECWARDEAHAIKIANDVRAQLIAEGKL